ncbi:Cas1p-domain-containing protein [Xylariaceae sp. FL0594]|nr:Cas1p-domain-containing protein [Xylariaceae sp. FL0594]
MAQLRRLAASWHPLSSVTYSTLSILLLWIVIPRFLAGRNDPDRCRALLTDGTWSPTSNGPNNAQQWEPNGCRMVEYRADDIHNCLDGRRFVLAGDSTIRQIFWAAARKLDPKLAAIELNEIVVAGEKHRDLTFSAGGVRLEFIWDPWLNSTTLKDTLDAFHAIPSPPPQKGTLVKKDQESAALLVLGAPGLWAARYGGDDFMSLFKDGIDTVARYLSLASEESNAKSNSLSQLPISNHGYEASVNQILLTPVQVPAYSALSTKRIETITPERVDKMNDYLGHLPSNQTSHVVWAFNQMTNESDLFESDGLHTEDIIADRKVDIVLNSHCNNPAVLHDRSFRGTCCVEEPSNNLFKAVLVCLGVVMLLALRAQPTSRFFRPEYLTASRDLLVTLAWCWACDGTLSFSKAERHYRQGAFVALCLLWLACSFLVVQKIVGLAGEVPWLPAKNREAKKDIAVADEHKFLSREQTDEIKGIMQGIILLYHYNHASQTLWVYKIVRVLISMYFFLSAYGHTLYLLKTEDYSFKRVAVVLFRTNLLSAVLPYMMGTNYSSYYFAPAVTVYYLVIYVMLRTLRESNSDPWPLAMKVLATASFVSVFITTPGYLEMVTDALRAVFGMSFDVHELRFRLGLDRYIVFAGVMVASLVHTATSTDAREMFTTKGSPRLFDSGRPRFWVVCFAGLGLYLYITQANLSTKQSYNAAHPYISWIPVLALITLRNLYTPAQKLFLAVPAALGRISLETYVLQYHIWLGGNATARLTLVGLENASFPIFLVEKAIITVLFIGLAALTHRATRTLTASLSEVRFLMFLAAMWAGNFFYA